MLELRMDDGKCPIIRFHNIYELDIYIVIPLVTERTYFEINKTKM